MHSGGLLLDVRESGEWLAGHASGARHIPLDELEGRPKSCSATKRWWSSAAPVKIGAGDKDAYAVGI